MKKASESKLFIFLGTLFLLISGFMIFVGFMAGSTPPPQAYSSLSMAVMTFSMSYLYPQFKQKDERMKLIRQKGMFYSYFALIFYYIALMIIVQFDILTLSAMDVLNILAALTISTVFISMVILAKRN